MGVGARRVPRPVGERRERACASRSRGTGGDGACASHPQGTSGAGDAGLGMCPACDGAAWARRRGGGRPDPGLGLDGEGHAGPPSAPRLASTAHPATPATCRRRGDANTAPLAAAPHHPGDARPCTVRSRAAPVTRPSHYQAAAPHWRREASSNPAPATRPHTPRNRTAPHAPDRAAPPGGGIPRGSCGAAGRLVDEPADRPTGRPADQPATAGQAFRAAIRALRAASLSSNFDASASRPPM